MEQLTDILRQATAAIGREYFLLPIHGGGPVYRERVYCYELYYQMRRRWLEDSPYRLNGEVDKRSYPNFPDLGPGEPKPDLLVHQPGTGHNFAVIEVKPPRASARNIRKDLKTLSLFRNALGYERAIYLVYGPRADNTLTRIQRCSANVAHLAATRDCYPPLEPCQQCLRKSFRQPRVNPQWPERAASVSDRGWS